MKQLFVITALLVSCISFAQLKLKKYEPTFPSLNLKIFKFNHDQIITKTGYKSEKVLIYTHDGINWNNTILTAPDDSTNTNNKYWGFGDYIHISDSNMVIVADEKAIDTNNTEHGALYFYHLSPQGEWKIETIFNNPEPSSNYDYYYGGSNTMLYKNHCISGWNNGTPVRLHYNRRNNKGEWEYVDTISVKNGYRFSSKPYLDDSLLIIKSFSFSKGTNINFYKMNQNGKWNESSIIETDISSQKYFGEKVILKNDTAFIPCSRCSVKVDTNIIENAGAVFTYVLKNNQWNVVDTMYSDTIVKNGYFGISIDLHDSLLFIGTYILSSTKDKGFQIHNLKTKKNTSYQQIGNSLSNNRDFNLSSLQFTKDKIILTDNYNVYEFVPDLDCHGDLLGTAKIDDCNVCSGGNTGITVNDCLITSDLENLSSNPLSVYPNPTNGLVTVYSKNIKIQTINIFNTHNQLIENYQINNLNEFQFELNQANGLYIIEIVSEQKIERVKLLLK